MILAAIELEDFKQFVGTHALEIPPEGMVGVIGANGAGKTTLFEAIEWCLYQPSSMLSTEIRPRGRAGQPRVKLVLHEPETDIRYVVERKLGARGAKAEIYREDQPESTIVQGSQAVTKYVANYLIGLEHAAFVSTFFTRQKELSFFGSMGPTERRREVGRLLGFETIRKAQEQISKERGVAIAEAKANQSLYEQASANRDFDEEKRIADETVNISTQRLTVAEQSQKEAAEKLIKAREQLDHVRVVERQDSELRQHVALVAGDEQAAQERRTSAINALANLDVSEQLRKELIPIAQTASARAASVAAFVTDKERFTQQQHLLSNLERLKQQNSAIDRKIRQEIARVTAPEFAGWMWTEQDSADLVVGVDRLIRVVQSVDAARAVAEATILRECRELAIRRNKAETEFIKSDRLLAELKQKRDALSIDGGPDQAMTIAQLGHESALKQRQDAISDSKFLSGSRKDLVPIIARLESQSFEDSCPTCGRPFSEHEASATLQTLKARVAALDSTIKQKEQQRIAADRDVQQFAKEMEAAREQQQQIAQLTGRIAQGEQVVEKIRREFDEAAAAYQRQAADHHIATEPTDNEVTVAEQRAIRWQTVAGMQPILQQFQSQIRDQADERLRIEQTLTELGTVNYDAAAHKMAEDALREAQHAAAQIARIERELERRPGHERDLQLAETDIIELQERKAVLEAQRLTVGFDQTVLDSAVVVEQSALEEEHRAIETRNRVQTELIAATNRREILQTEQKRIRELLERANVCQREADILDRMYREFTEFDQYVAAQVTPELAEQTSMLLSEVTDGKYDHVTFDENYGLLVFDGTDEKFPVEGFSGGERDVIALCARLALSRMIGGQAASPPSFLVLDEVFGSLDRDRRAHVLDTLGQLSGTAEAFQQLFIISHVDDVRNSPIFSDIWRVNETDDGISELENLGLAEQIEELL